MAPTNLASPYTSRPGSACSNDRWSVTSPAPFSAPDYTPNPPPAYVAAAAASQLVADHHLNQNPDYEQAGPDSEDEEPQEMARFSPEALTLLNTFLDHTLYNILATSMSGKLKKLRPAITEVLKPRLAREAIASADEELRELLDGEGDDEEDEEEEELKPAPAANGTETEGVADLRNGARHGDSNFSLALTWKRTRLRIMVYTRHGDLEDEDEDRYLVDDEDFHNAKHQEAQRAKWGGENDADTIADLGLVSPAAAIFLTSVVEYLAEQTIIVAGQACSSRFRKAKPAANSGAQEPKLTVLDVDMEKVALNPTLGRLWRTWRKRLRGTTTPGSPTSPTRRGNFGSLGSLGGPRSIAGESSAWSEADAGGSRRPSVAVADAEAFKPEADVPDTKEYSELEMASNIALPLPEGGDERDVKEIEIPGLAPELTDVADSPEHVEQPVKRRASLSEKQEPKSLGQDRPQLLRLRSTSAPGIAPSGSWLDYLLGRSQQQPEAVGSDAEDEADSGKAVPAEETGGQEAENGGIIAGAAAAVGAVVSAVVGQKEADDGLEPAAAGSDTAGETAEAMAKQRSVSKLFDEVDEPVEQSDALDNEEDDQVDKSVPSSPTKKAAPKRLSDQERALRAAETHIRSVSHNSLQKKASAHSMPGAFRDSSSDAETLRPDQDRHEDALDDEEDLSRPKHLSAMPAPLSIGAKASSPVEEQPNRLSAGEPGPTIVTSADGEAPISPIDRGQAEKWSDHEDPSPVSPQATEPEHLDASSVAGPAALATAVGAAGVAAAVGASKAGGSADPGIAAQQQPAANVQHVVDDDYDPFSSVAYPPTNRISRIPAPEDVDPSAIGVARSSDRAIPAPRTPSPQIPPVSAQQSGIQSQMESYSQQRQLGVRGVNGSPAQQHVPDFAPPSVRDPNNQRPRSAHRGDSALSGHRDVTAFATAPAVHERSERPSSSRGPQDQSAPKNNLTLQAISNASEALPARSDRRSQPQQAQQAQTGQLSAAAAAEAAARPTSSKSARRSTVGSHDGSGLMPRPVDASRASSESKRRDFEDLLKNGDNETMKYTLTPVRVTDETSSNTTTTLKPSPVGSDRPTAHVASPTNSSTALRPQPTSSNAVGGTSTIPTKQAELAPHVEAETASATQGTRRKSQFIAREPRIRQESMRDFADFIRTTGPDKEMNVVPLIPRSGSRQAGSVPNTNGFDSTPGVKRASTMQARDPAVKRENNRDLMDFLREGPPGENGAASRPARTTAAPSAASVAPFNKDEQGSRSAAAPAARAAQPTSTASMLSAPENGMPKKTRRRVKDPYAIDLDDEDDDLLTALPGAQGRPQRQEESLIDFLRNSEPPSGNSPQTLAIGANANGPTANGASSTNGTNAGSGSRTNSLSNGPRMQVRSAGGTSRDARTESSRAATSDLADFLKNSGPPGSSSGAGGPTGGSSSSGLPSGKAAKMLGGAAPELQRTSSKGSTKSAKFWKRRTTIDA